MPHYMFQGGYSPETWARLVKNPEDRQPVLERLMAQNGGKLISFFYSFGSDDFVLIVELPNNYAAAAIPMALASSGALQNLRTTPLLTVKEATESMRKARGIFYRPPGAAESLRSY